MTNRENRYPESMFLFSIGVSFAAGLAGGILVSNRMSAARRMPHAADWERYMAGHCGHVRANCMINRVESRYWNLFCQRPPMVDPALRQHLNDHILPALALYQVLQENGMEMEQSLSEVERMMYAAIAPLRKPLEWIGRFPIFFTLLRKLTPDFTHRTFPPAGWKTEWVENSEQSVVFNMNSCFYLETFREYGVPELTLVFCRLDDLIYEGLSPHVRWERTGTLARGNEVCDFRWTRI